MPEDRTRPLLKDRGGVKMKKDIGPTIFMVLLYSVFALYMGYAVYISYSNSEAEEERIELLKEQVDTNNQLLKLLRRGEDE